MEKKAGREQGKGGKRGIVGKESSRSAGGKVLGEDKEENDRNGDWLVQEELRERSLGLVQEQGVGRRPVVELKGKLGPILGK